MTQRNPMNDRYTTDEKRAGKTRKSSASAKPKATRAATLRDPAPKTKKQKKEEARERERKEQQKAGAIEGRFEETETYKKLRRYWWIALIGAIACTALSFVFQTNETLKAASLPIMLAAYALIIIAFWIDLGKIRKERKIYAATVVSNKSKEARREQKRMRAEQREQEREAAEKFEQAKAEETEKAANRGGFLSRFRKPKDEPTDSVEEAKQDEVADKAKESSK